MTHEPHPWQDVPPAGLPTLLLRELYGPTSALAASLDQILSWPADPGLRVQLEEETRTALDNLSRVLVLLKRYTDQG